MDNIWVSNSTRPIKDGRQTLNYWCRLWREPAEKWTVSQKIRTVEVCMWDETPCMYKIWKGNQLISVTLSRNENSWGKDRYLMLKVQKLEENDRADQENCI